MEIKESEIREQYKNEFGITYYKIPMKYILWRREKIKEWMKTNFVRIIRDDPESYPDHPKAKRINCSQAIWIK